ncbi:hypothetical protein JR316_0004948 [Psilocybe cubensis]|uniref:Topoisomerase I damage affected protein 2 n=2 Tax=Psilocybe cubensis TaxID=181762 RepID=A0A8H8CLV8_PSICU|nr:hypothetical protein JR316_0004948 [Psilocybe cubensis]KAH9482848.1 hypothetical protein JR316_0004948 [Psilocybe cubensis]
MSHVSDLRSPAPSRSLASSPRPKFDADLLKAYMRKLLSSTLQSSAWPGKDRDRLKGWMKEIGERVKERMLEIQPRGFKYVVLVQINENLGQGGRWAACDCFSAHLAI